MPSAAANSHLGFVCKKRRRDEFSGLSALHSIHSPAATSTTLPPEEDDDEVHSILVDEKNNNNRHRVQLLNSSSHRKILPVAKRPRFEENPKQAQRTPLHERTSAAAPAAVPAAASATASAASAAASAAAAAAVGSAAVTRPPPLSSSSIAPCHICHRRPKRRCDLDSLADCEGCGQRTCFVCLRECLGPAPRPVPMTANSWRWPSADTQGRETSLTPSPPMWSRGSSGHRRMICSRCCVERGQDGEVVCLGCLPFVEG